MQLKALAAVVSVALTLGVQAAPNAFDKGAGVKDLLKRSYSHGVDMSQVAKRAIALGAKKRESNRHRRDGKRCVARSTPSTPAPPSPPVTVEAKPTTQQPQTTPDTQEPTSSPEPTPSPAPEPEKDTPTPAPEPEKDTPTPAPEPTKDNNNNNNNGSGGTAPDNLAQEWLDGHNAARAQHGADPLTWSNELASAAQQWASGCNFKHSGGSLGPFGENLAAQTGSMSPTEGLKMWTDEVGEYDPNNPQPSHFTQVVWKGSTQLGCAIVKCAPGTVFDAESFYGVCEYSPAGNVIGNFADNVQK